MKLNKTSLDYIKNTDLAYRKKMGQYFTPKDIRDVLMDCLPKMKAPLVLEPSCGTGEFLTSIYEYFDNPMVHGVELDKTLAELCSNNFPMAKIRNLDTLRTNFAQKYDFVLGNPPYFEFSPDEDVREKYGNILHGRPNIYACFIKLGLDVLKDGGYLAYVVPTSMNNGAYFSRLREYIIERAEIENIITFDSDNFEDAQQNVMIIVLRKSKNTGKFVFKKNNITIFTKQYDQLNKYYDGKKSLKELGFSVKTGGIVWNQVKNNLTNLEYSANHPAFPDGYCTLVWAHNIVDNKIELNNNEKKKQYVRIKKGAERGRAIVVNRITGVGESANIRAAIIDESEWHAENHVNVIYRKDDPHVPLHTLREIHKQLTSPETLKLIRSITGNTQLSKTELENLIPIKLGE